MAMSDTLQLIGMIVGGLIALGIQAGGLIVYWNKAITAIKDGFQDDLASQARAHAAAIEALHGRINNVRKEFVPGELYQRDVTEMKQGQREILVAIHTLGMTTQAKITQLETTNAVQEYRLGAIDDVLNNRNVSRGSTV